MSKPQPRTPDAKPKPDLAQRLAQVRRRVERA
jgi:hypothetical protein